MEQNGFEKNSNLKMEWIGKLEMHFAGVAKTASAEKSCRDRPAKLSSRLGDDMSSQAVGKFLMNLSPKDRHIPGSSESQFYAISVNSQHDDFDVLANKDLLAHFSAKNQHAVILLAR